jgi:outer membrane immunogenic protein
MATWRWASVAAVALIVAPASAADIPSVYKAPRAPIVAPLVQPWSGCYVGAHIGGGWGRAKWIDPQPAPGQVSTDEGTSDISGFLAGGQVGCNHQIGPWVFGAEADASWADLTGDHPNPIFVPDIMHTKVNALGTVTGRIGRSFDRALFYVKGGGAWTDIDYSVSTPAAGVFATASEMRWGWTVGAGVEYALTPEWSLKFEYGYLDFGTERVRLTCPVCGAGFFDKDIDQQIHTAKFGANYRVMPGAWR